MRKLTILIIVVLIAASVLITGCKKSDESQVLDTVRQYVKYMNAEDAGEVYIMFYRDMRSIGLKNSLETQFAIYDIEMKLEKLEFQKIEDEIAYVDYTWTMVDKGESDFKDLRSYGTFLLKQDEGVWKIIGFPEDPAKPIEYLNP